MTLSRIQQSNPEFENAELIGAQIRVRGGVGQPYRGPLGFIEDLLRSANNQIEFEGQPPAGTAAERMQQRQRLIQSVMRDQD